jgi:hypothetical protein
MTRSPFSAGDLSTFRPRLGGGLEVLSPRRLLRQGTRPHAACGGDDPADTEGSVNYQERLWVPTSPAIPLELERG